MPKSTSAPARGGNGRPTKAAAANGRSPKASSNGSGADGGARDRRYDAIVIGGGHNGLVNGAYLAKAGLKTLILERRHLVGGAAITEELRPGFWFTTFSYALSLLRPDIIHDLELDEARLHAAADAVDLRPDGERRLPAPRPGPRREPPRDLPPQRPRRRRLRRVQPRRPARLPGDQAAPRPGPAGPLQRRSRGARPAGRDGLAAPEARQEGPPRRGPPPDRQRRGLPRRLLRIGHPQGLPRLVLDHRDEGRAVLAGIRARAPVPHPRRARRRVRGVGVPQAGQRRVHQGPRPGGPVVRRRDRPRVARRPRDHEGRPGDRRRPRRRPRARGLGRRLGRRPAADVPRARRPARAADRSRRDDRAVPVPGHVGEGELRPRRGAALPGPRRPGRPVPRLHEHRPVDGVPRAGLRRREVRLVLEAAVHRHGDPVDDRPGHGARPAST